MIPAMRVFACLATSMDGKIASAKNLRARFGSPADLTHLLTVRNQAEAILCGGETFRQHMGLRHGNQQSVPPLQIILTHSFNLPPEAGLFRQSMQFTPATPILIVSPQPALPETKARYPEHVEWLVTGKSNPVLFILENLAQKGIANLSVEGGGHIVNLFLQAKALQEMYLTLCPLFLGGKDDPSLVSGTGFEVSQAPGIEVLSQTWKDQELYLHLKIKYHS
jgi:5-amino-6-(5-phosphoribosylamino)uracil reductase